MLLERQVYLLNTPFDSILFSYYIGNEIDSHPKVTNWCMYHSLLIMSVRGRWVHGERLTSIHGAGNIACCDMVSAAMNILRILTIISLSATQISNIM